jgi:hypothetical protein
MLAVHCAIMEQLVPIVTRMHVHDRNLGHVHNVKPRADHTQAKVADPWIGAEITMSVICCSFIVIVYIISSFVVQRRSCTCTSIVSSVYIADNGMYATVSSESLRY